MSIMFNLPNCKHVAYSMNVQTGYFTKTDQQSEPTGTTGMPFELIREKTICTHILAEYSLFKHSYKDNKSRIMFTGLQPCRNFNNWYLGDNYGQVKGSKINELLLIFIASKNDRMNVFYFPAFYKITEDLRQEFATSTIHELEKRIYDYEQ